MRREGVNLVLIPLIVPVWKQNILIHTHANTHWDIQNEKQKRFWGLKINSISIQNPIHCRILVCRKCAHSIGGGLDDWGWRKDRVRFVLKLFWVAILLKPIYRVACSLHVHRVLFVPGCRTTLYKFTTNLHRWLLNSRHGFDDMNGKIPSCNIESEASKI